MKFKDLRGKVMGRLTIQGRVGHDKHGKILWKAVCECGKEVTICSDNLLAKKTKSCGCLRNRKRELNPTYTGYEGISGEFWGSIKSGARDRELIFNITKEIAWSKFLNQEGRCALTGCPLNFIEKTASLDRIDSKRGYEKDNIQWVLKEINMMKRNYSQESFIELCRKVSEHNKSNEVK